MSGKLQNSIITTWDDLFYVINAAWCMSIDNRDVILMYNNLGEMFSNRSTQTNV